MFSKKLKNMLRKAALPSLLGLFVFFMGTRFGALYTRQTAWPGGPALPVLAAESGTDQLAAAPGGYRLALAVPPAQLSTQTPDWLLPFWRLPAWQFPGIRYLVQQTAAPIGVTGQQAVEQIPGTESILLFDANASVQTVDWSLDNRFLYAGASNIGLVVVNADILSLYRIADAYKDIAKISIAPQTYYLALAEASDNSIQLFSRETQQVVRTLQAGHSDTPTVLVFNPSVENLVSCGLDGNLFLWDVASGERLMTLHEGSVCSDAAFSPSGLLLAAGFDEEGVVRLWDTASWEEILSFEVAGVTDLAIDRSGTRLLAASGADYTDARVYNLYTGNRLMTLDEGSPVWAVTYSPNGRWLLTAGEGRKVSVWDPQTGALLYELEANMAKIDTLDFNPAGTMLAAAGDSVRLWKIASLNLK